MSVLILAPAAKPAVRFQNNPGATNENIERYLILIFAGNVMV